MKHRPILFSTPMVQAIMEGSKTQTRRVCRHQYWQHSELVDVNENKITDKVDRNVSCSYGNIGDLLWVRETWRVRSWDDEDANIDVQFRDGTTMEEIDDFYIDDFDRMLERILSDMEKRCEPHVDEEQERFYWTDEQIDQHMPWKPSIHMPKAYARIWLRITDVKVERLRSISEEDAKAEGAPHQEWTAVCTDEQDKGYKYGFINIWNSIHKSTWGPTGWNSDPWVWVVKFEVLTIDGMLDGVPMLDLMHIEDEYWDAMTKDGKVRIAREPINQ